MHVETDPVVLGPKVACLLGLVSLPNTLGPKSPDQVAILPAQRPLTAATMRTRRRKATRDSTTQCRHRGLLNDKFFLYAARNFDGDGVL